MTAADTSDVAVAMEAAVDGLVRDAMPQAKTDIVYVTGNIGRLGLVAQSRERLLEGLYQGISSALGPDITVVVPTHSWSLVGTQTVFDRQATPSESGPFTEHVRRLPGAVRQFHPFGSVTALGPLAEALCGSSTRHLYGVDTPYHRILQRPAMGLSLGILPHRAVTLIHHIEFVMGVPYRYTKEFLHPVIVDGVGRIEPFYLHVTYRDADIIRDGNKKFFAEYEKAGAIAHRPLGRTTIYGFDLVRFANTATAMLAKNIYAWLETPPEIRPYQR